MLMIQLTLPYPLARHIVSFVCASIRGWNLMSVQFCPPWFSIYRCMLPQISSLPRTERPIICDFSQLESASRTPYLDNWQGRGWIKLIPNEAIVVCFCREKSSLWISTIWKIAETRKAFQLDISLYLRQISPPFHFTIEHNAHHTYHVSHHDVGIGLKGWGHRSC